MFFKFPLFLIFFYVSILFVKRRISKGLKNKLANWGSDQKLQACACYVMLGNLREVALATDIPYETLKVWKAQDWWKDLILQIRDEDIQKLDVNLQRIVTKSLKVIEDRLDKGEYQYDPKTGKVMRIPIKANIALRVSTELLTKQDKLRLEPLKLEVEKTIDARLAKLAEEFSRFSRSRDVTPRLVMSAPEGGRVVLSPPEGAPPLGGECFGGRVVLSPQEGASKPVIYSDVMNAPSEPPEGGRVFR